MTHLIVGAGISGLYTAYKLLNKDINNITIIEKSKRFGGRIKTINHKSYRYDVGAGRLGKKQKLVMKLIKEFNLEHLMVDINPNKHYFVDNQMLNEKELLEYYNSKFKSLGGLWTYVITFKTNQNPRKFSFHNYISLFLDKNEINVLERSLGYINEMYRLNAYDAMYTLKKDFDVKDNDFFILKGGLHILCQSLYDYLKSKNVTIQFNTSLQDIQDNYILTNHNNKIKYSKLYLAVCKKAYMSIPYFIPHKELFDTVSVGNLLRIYAKYDVSKNSWMKKIIKTTTDNKLQFIIPIKEDLIQISYSDDYIANFWNSLPERETINQITRCLKEMFPNDTVAEPLWITKHYWCCGSHFWKPGVNSDKTIKEINKIDKNIYIVGEIYSKRQAWIEGALESVEGIM